MYGDVRRESGCCPRNVFSVEYMDFHVFLFSFQFSRYRSNRSGGILGQQSGSSASSSNNTTSSTASAGVSITWTRSCQVFFFFFSNPHSFVARQLKPNQNTQATCSKQPCLSCAGNPLLTPANSPAAAAAAAVAAAASAAETEHRIYLRSHRQRRNQQLLQIQQQQQQQQVANLTLRPWTRSRAQQVLHHYQLEQLHPSHTGTTPTTKTINNCEKRLDSRLFCLNRCRLFD